MPQAASRKQYRFMMAILHSKKVKQHARGNPPKSIAAKYTDPGKDAPESKDNDRGGSWTEKHHKRHEEREKKKKHLKKTFEDFYKDRYGNTLQYMLEVEALEKAGKKSKMKVNNKHALKLVGTGLYRHLKQEVGDMGDEAFKEIELDTHKVSIRKHTDDTYSGRVSDGHKVIYQYTNKSLHELTAALMSVFEWYLPEDEDVLDMVSDESMSDDVIHGGLQHLVDSYKKHNLGEIYQEMETIRETIRNGVAVDLQQVESKILKLFDRLEETAHDIVDKHNKLAQDAGKEMDELEAKLRELQNKINEKPKGSKTVEAFSSNPANSSKVHNKLYSYLSKPRVEIQPTGKIIISFGDDWEEMEKSNFLEDMRVKVAARKK